MREGTIVSFSAFMEHYRYWLMCHMHLEGMRWLFEDLDSYTYRDLEGPDPDAAYEAAEMRGIFARETGFRFEGMPEEGEWGMWLRACEDVYDMAFGGRKAERDWSRMLHLSVAEGLAWLARILEEEAGEFVKTDDYWYDTDCWLHVMLYNMHIFPAPRVDDEPTAYGSDMTYLDRGTWGFGRTDETEEDINRRIARAVRKWVNRKYTRYGVGGPFPLKPDKSLVDRRLLTDEMQAREYAERSDLRRDYAKD